MINIIFILIALYILWEGLQIKIGKDIEIEVYSVKRLFKKGDKKK